ncbi:MAG: lactate utilization protein [Anaerolineae bacterium]|nr:lactate utilization protein [Anaerolineae bacterium]
MSNSSRDRILATLRASHPPFPDAPARPANEDFIPVTKIGSDDLIARFKTMLEGLTGKVHICADEAEAIRTIRDLIGTDRRIMAWDRLPLPELVDQLRADGIDIVEPHARGDQRLQTLHDVEPIRVGVTGADAGLATTGSLVMITSEGQGRIPSLMPPVHVAILRKERLFANLEAWMNAEGKQALEGSNSITLITGPSRTGDIEMILVLGVHGPGVIHVVIC